MIKPKPTLAVAQTIRPEPAVLIIRGDKMPKGIVYVTSSGLVRYKYDTSTYPTLKDDESLKDRDDINNIEVNAIYDPKTDQYINPVLTQLKVKELKDWKAEYKDTKDINQKLDILAKYIGLLE